MSASPNFNQATATPSGEYSHKVRSSVSTNPTITQLIDISTRPITPQALLRVRVELLKYMVSIGRCSGEDAARADRTIQHLRANCP